MNTLCRPRRSGSGTALVIALILVACPARLAHAQDNKKNPASKVYVSDVSGEAQIDTGENIQDLNKRSVYSASGTVIETKKAEREDDKSKVYSTMVYSNGTGSYFDHDTRVEVKKFVQEPFTPNRTDMEVEPSISQTQAFVARGTVGLCTSKLVAGSNMTYQTSLGSINIRGRKVVIQADEGQTKISMLEGESTVRAGSLDMGGQTLHAGEQAIIRAGVAGGPGRIQITRIPPAEASQLDDKVSMACMAKKTVYFEIKERQITNEPEKVASESAAPPQGETGTKESSSTSTTSAPITAFDGNSATSNTTNTITVVNRGPAEIIAVPVVPTNLPLDFTISPARITKPGGGG